MEGKVFCSQDATCLRVDQGNIRCQEFNAEPRKGWRWRLKGTLLSKSDQKKEKKEKAVTGRSRHRLH